MVDLFSCNALSGLLYRKLSCSSLVVRVRGVFEWFVNSFCCNMVPMAVLLIPLTASIVIPHCVASCSRNTYVCVCCVCIPTLR